MLFEIPDLPRTELLFASPGSFVHFPKARITKREAAKKTQILVARPIKGEGG